MGCGCSGSVRQPAAQQQEKKRGSETRKPTQSRSRVGGPGHPDYYWSGPQRADDAAKTTE